MNAWSRNSCGSNVIGYGILWREFSKQDDLIVCMEGRKQRAPAQCTIPFRAVLNSSRTILF